MLQIFKRKEKTGRALYSPDELAKRLTGRVIFEAAAAGYRLAPRPVSTTALSDTIADWIEQNMVARS